VAYAIGVASLCCPACRLIQRAPRCIDCGADTTALADLTRSRIEGLTTVPKQPPRGWRDALALLATVFGALGAAAGGLLLTNSPAGMLLGPAVGIFGYRKQFWRAALKRGPRLGPVPVRDHPEGEPLIGVAQPFERTLAGGAIAIATTIATAHGVIARAIDAAPFWLVLGDRRVLVAGACWVAGLPTQRRAVVGALLREIEASDLPLDQVGKVRLQVLRVAVAPGDRVAVLGRLRDEQLAGVGGYRDSLIETVRGEPGALVWIERLEPAPAPRGR